MRGCKDVWREDMRKLGRCVRGKDAMTCRGRIGVRGCKDAFRQYTGGAPWQTQTRGKFLPAIANR